MPRRAPNAPHSPPRRLRPLGALGLIAALAAVGCGPEKTLTGRWQQDLSVDCEPEEGALCELRDVGDSWIYELHVHRFGDEVTGVFLRMRWEGGAAFDYEQIDTCRAISGTAEGDGRLDLTLDLPAELPEAAFPATGCRDRDDFFRLTLEGDDERLEGWATCGPPDRSRPPNIAFQRARARPLSFCPLREGSN